MFRLEQEANETGEKMWNYLRMSKGDFRLVFVALRPDAEV